MSHPPSMPSLKQKNKSETCVSSIIFSFASRGAAAEGWLGHRLLLDGSNIPELLTNSIRV